MNIEKQLKDKTAKERANLKSKGLAKVKIGKFTKNGIEIEIIGDIEKIDGGIQLFAKAWAGQDIKVYKVTERVVPNGIVERKEVFDRIMKKGEQFGFGKDGSVEIERFRFFNPPVLVDDENGDIIKESTNLEGETEYRKLKYNPDEVIRQILEQTIKIVGKENTNIIIGKVGNTTSTFYSSAGDGEVGREARPSWNDAHDTIAGTYTDYTSDSVYISSYYVSSSNIYVRRGFFPFDTSALPNDDVISSASLHVSGYGTVENVTDYLGVVQTNPASNTALANGDYDECGKSLANGWSSAFSTDIIEGMTTRVNLSDITGTFAFREFVLNSTGQGWINKTGYTKLGLRMATDLDDDALTSITERNHFRLYTSAKDGATTTNDPKLVVVHEEEVSDTGAFFQLF